MCDFLWIRITHCVTMQARLLSPEAFGKITTFASDCRLWRPPRNKLYVNVSWGRVGGRPQGALYSCTLFTKSTILKAGMLV